MEDDDSDAEMADYGTDSSDDVDPNFDAKARPQQGSVGVCRLHSPMPAHCDGCNGPIPEGRAFSTHVHPGGEAACSLSRTLNRSRMLPVRALA